MAIIARPHKPEKKKPEPKKEIKEKTEKQED